MTDTQKESKRTLRLPPSYLVTLLHTLLNDELRNQSCFPAPRITLDNGHTVRVDLIQYLVLRKTERKKKHALLEAIFKPKAFQRSPRLSRTGDQPNTSTPKLTFISKTVSASSLGLNVIDVQ